MAGEAPPPVADDPQLAIVLAIVGALGAALLAGITGLFQLMTARANRTSSSPPAPEPAEHAGKHGERLSVVEYRLDEIDDAREIVDHRLDRLERILDERRGGP